MKRAMMVAAVAAAMWVGHAHAGFVPANRAVRLANPTATDAVRAFQRGGMLVVDVRTEREGYGGCPAITFRDGGANGGHNQMVVHDCRTAGARDQVLQVARHNCQAAGVCPYIVTRGTLVLHIDARLSLRHAGAYQRLFAGL